MRVSVEKGHPRQVAALCRWAEARRWPGHASPGSGIRARALSCRKGIKSRELGVAGAGQGVRGWGFPGAHLQPLALGGAAGQEGPVGPQWPPRVWPTVMRSLLTSLLFFCRRSERAVHIQHPPGEAT